MPGDDDYRVGHDHEHATGHDGHRAFESGVILDVGGDVGALILYTDPGYEGREIELSREDDADAPRVHTAIHRRSVAGRAIHAGVFPALAAGRYRIWVPEPGLQDEATIVGGEVTVVDWRPGEGPAR